MISVLPVMFACCLLVAVATSANYAPPLMRDLIQQDQPTYARAPGQSASALCWDGNVYNDECQKQSSSIRQLLLKMLYKLKTDERKSEDDLRMDEISETNRQAKKRQEEEKTGFYSNW